MQIPPTGERNLKIAWGLFVLAVLVIAMVQGVRFMTHGMIDFTVVYRVGVRILHGQAIYDFTDGIMLFKYAPIIGYILTPLAFLPKLPCAFLFFLLSVASFGACFHLAFSWVVPKGAQGWAPFAVLALSLLTTLRFIMNSLDYGQVQVFVLLGMLYCMHYFASGKYMRGGFVLSLLALSKVIPAVLCVPWLVRKLWRPAAATAALSALLLAAPVLWLGPSRAVALTAQWWNLLRVSTDQFMIEWWMNQSILSALARIFTPTRDHVNWFYWDMRHVVILTNVILALWLCFIVWLGYRRDESRFPSAGFARALDVSHYLLFTILAPPLSWRHYFTSLILPNMLIFTYLFFYARRDWATWGLMIAAFVLGSVFNKEIVGIRVFEWVHLRSCLTICTLLTLIALVRIDFHYGWKLTGQIRTSSA